MFLIFELLLYKHVHTKKVAERGCWMTRTDESVRVCVHSTHNPINLTVNHGQTGFVKEPDPSVLEEPYGENG